MSFGLITVSQTKRRRRKNGHKTIVLGYKEGKLIDNENQYAN